MQRAAGGHQWGHGMTAIAWASTALPPPRAWSATPQYPDGACRRCCHSTPGANGLGCACPAVAGRGAPVPVASARQLGGACGIEAQHHQYQPARR